MLRKFSRSLQNKDTEKENISVWLSNMCVLKAKCYLKCQEVKNASKFIK